IHVDVRKPDGTPTEHVYVVLWREIDKLSPQLNYFGCDWTDKDNRKWRMAGSWNPISGGHFTGDFSVFTPRSYRVPVASDYAMLKDHGRNTDPTPFRFSDPVRVDAGYKPTPVTVQLVDGSPLELQVVDKQTGEPIERAQLRLFGPEGQPIVSCTWGNG